MSRRPARPRPKGYLCICAPMKFICDGRRAHAIINNCRVAGCFFCWSRRHRRRSAPSQAMHAAQTAATALAAHPLYYICRRARRAGRPLLPLKICRNYALATPTHTRFSQCCAYFVRITLFDTPCTQVNLFFHPLENSCQIRLRRAKAAYTYFFSLKKINSKTFYIVGLFFFFSHQLKNLCSLVIGIIFDVRVFF